MFELFLIMRGVDRYNENLATAAAAKVAQAMRASAVQANAVQAIDTVQGRGAEMKVFDNKRTITPKVADMAIKAKDWAEITPKVADVAIKMKDLIENVKEGRQPAPGEMASTTAEIRKLAELVELMRGTS